MDSQITEVVIRSFGAYTILLIINNMLGKQTLSQMTNHDFITSIMMGAIAANLAFDTQVSYWHSFIALLIIGGIGYSTTYLSMKNRGVRKWFSGSPSVFIENGKILESNMKKQKYNMDSLNQSLREKNIFNIEEVKYAVLEPDGHLSVMRKEKGANLFPVELIMDGKIVEKNLRDIKLSEDWLIKEVSRRGYAVNDVFYCVRGPDGTLAFDYKDDRLKAPIDRER
ncbi:DUF421 domain-containing protein [Alteribacter salitolerans]|uniref:DUF421 domain-containing protein n=1 Tax=Alteribacter salitolerans TaxID=2912333 RepID=UPI001F47C20A|nr:DUF421 domain-containing protein [Alteribacter salitolerans]